MRDFKKEIKDAYDFLRRTQSNKLTSKDIAICSNAPINCSNNFEVAQWHIEKIKKEKLQYQGTLLSQGLLFDFANDTAAAANILFRGKLFRPIANGRRKWISDDVLAEWGDMSISYSGITLDQADLDVLLCLGRELSAATATGNVVNLTSKDSTGKENIEYKRIFLGRIGFLREMHKDTGKGDKIWLEQSLNRLAGNVTYKKGNEKMLSGPIVGKHGYDETKDLMFVDINESFAKSFLIGGYTIIGWNKRLNLKRPIYKWLQGYVCSHSSPHYQTADKLHSMISNSKNVAEWYRKSLKPALKKLEEEKILKNVKITGRKIVWERGSWKALNNHG